MDIQLSDLNECLANVVQITNEQYGTKGHCHNYGA